MSTVKTAGQVWSGRPPAITGDRVKAPPEVPATRRYMCDRRRQPALAYVECSQTAKGDNRWLPGRAVGWFPEQGITCRRILSTTAPPIARMTAKSLSCLWTETHPHQPLHPQTNGKAERLSKTILSNMAM